MSGIFDGMFQESIAHICALPRIIQRDKTTQRKYIVNHLNKQIYNLKYYSIVY